MSESANEIGKLTIVGSVIGGCLTFDVGTLLQINHAAGMSNMVVFYVAVLLSIVACGYGIHALLRYFIVFEVDRDESFYHALIATYIGFNIMVMALCYWRLPPGLAYFVSMLYMFIVILTGRRLIHRNSKRLEISKERQYDASMQMISILIKWAQFIRSVESPSLSVMHSIVCGIDQVFASGKNNAPNAAYRNLFEECQNLMLDVYDKLGGDSLNNANSLETAKTAQIIVVEVLENLSRQLSGEIIKQYPSLHPGPD
jgi:hypothetical protein